MENKFYTIDQVAGLLDMHHKTIRKFISEGQLRASKVGRQWRISGHDLSVFMEKSNEVPDTETVNEELSVEYSSGGNREDRQKQIHVSSVIDMNEMEKDEYIRVSNTLIAIANSYKSEEDGHTIQIKYDERDKRVRVILWGSIAFTENILSSVSMIVG